MSISSHCIKLRVAMVPFQHNFRQWDKNGGKGNCKNTVPKVLFKDLNPGIAMAIVRFKFSRKLYFCFVSVIRQKFNFFAFSEMAQKFWFWLHWMKRNYDFVLVDDKVLKFKSIQNWNWKFLLNFLEIAIKVIHFMYYLI